MLDSSLHTSYIVSRNLAPLVPCKYCNETDHASQDCTLAPLRSPIKALQRERLSPLCLVNAPSWLRQTQYPKGSASHGTGVSAPSPEHVPTNMPVKSVTPQTTEPKIAHWPLQTLTISNPPSTAASNRTCHSNSSRVCVF